jgi:hypothetical protein
MDTDMNTDMYKYKGKDKDKDMAIDLNAGLSFLTMQHENQ